MTDGIVLYGLLFGVVCILLVINTVKKTESHEDEFSEYDKDG